MSKNNIDGIFNRFLKNVNIISDFKSASSLLIWDQEVLMPSSGAEARSRVCETVALHIHHLTEDKSFVNDINILFENQNSLSDFQGRCLQRFHETAKRSWKISKELTGKLAKTTAIAQAEWSRAKKEKSFSLFAPYLEEIISLKKEEASQVGYQEHPYDALLDEYEPSLKTKQLDDIFSDSLPKLKLLRNKCTKIVNRERINTIFIPKHDQQKFVQQISKDIGFDLHRGRIDTGNHPATEFIHKDDIRIIARFDEKTIFTGIFLTLHEIGHGIYYQNIDESFSSTPLYESSSTSISESQARLWENNIAKSIPFWQGQFSKLQSIAKNTLSETKLNDFVCFINNISNSPIRFDADEISYVFHIYIRFLIEKKLIEGSLKVKDVPECWDALMEEYLGIKVHDVSEGCLQDVHWACGLIGYFPTYFLGSIYAAETYKILQNKISSFDSLLAKKQYSEIILLLTESIYKHGSFYTPKELRERNGNVSTISPQVFIDYITEKYNKIKEIS